MSVLPLQFDVKQKQQNGTFVPSFNQILLVHIVIEFNRLSSQSPVNQTSAGILSRATFSLFFYVFLQLLFHLFRRSLSSCLVRLHLRLYTQLCLVRLRRLLPFLFSRFFEQLLRNKVFIFQFSLSLNISPCTNNQNKQKRCLKIQLKNKNKKM